MVSRANRAKCGIGLRRSANYPVAYEVRLSLLRVFVDAADWTSKPLNPLLRELLEKHEALLDDKVSPADHITAPAFTKAKASLLAAVEGLPETWRRVVMKDRLDASALIVGLQALTCSAALGGKWSLETNGPAFSRMANRSRTDLQREQLGAELETHLDGARSPLTSLREKSPECKRLAALDQRDLAAYEAAWTVVSAEHTFWLAGVEYHKAFAAVTPNTRISLRR